MVARMQKMKSGNLGGIERHNQRTFENHSNPDIDPEKQDLNYDLVNDEPINYKEKNTRNYRHSKGKSKSDSERCRFSERVDSY